MIFARWRTSVRPKIKFYLVDLNEVPLHWFGFAFLLHVWSMRALEGTSPMAANDHCTGVGDKQHWPRHKIIQGLTRSVVIMSRKIWDSNVWRLRWLTLNPLDHIMLVGHSAALWARLLCHRLRLRLSTEDCSQLFRGMIFPGTFNILWVVFQTFVPIWLQNVTKIVAW